MRRLLLLSAFLLGAWAIAAAATPTAYGCAQAITPHTYESLSHRGAYLFAEELAGYNMIAPNDGFFGTPIIEQGPRGARTIADQPYIPPTLLKSIGYIESALAQAANSVPWGATGPALISFDCGHGIMQITSGMTSPADNGWPSNNQSLVATHYVYNIARGAVILADKWNAAPQARPVVGAGDPTIVEDWYYAVWSYNGFSGVNNPLERGQWPRNGYSCGPADDGFGHNRGNYPYQELVYGCASRPPQPGGAQLWEPPAVPYALPELSDPAWRLPISNFPNSSAMDIDTPPPWHFDSTERPPAGSAAFVLGAPSLSVNRSQLNTGTNAVTISNGGNGILAWQAQPSRPGIHVDRQAGVALGPAVPCSGDGACDRNAMLTVTVDQGVTSGWVDIESLTGGGARRLSVTSAMYDVNCDGRSDSVDAVLILQLTAGLIAGLPCQHNADANGDGVITAVDAAIILQHDIGLI